MAFLTAYAVCGVISEACRKADVPRHSHYDWLADDETYRPRFEAAHAEACESIETEIRRRAIEGIEEPVIYQGQLCFEPVRDKKGVPVRDDNGYIKLSDRPLTVKKKSDVLLIFQAKAMMPDRYRDNSKVEMVGSGGGPINLSVAFVKP